MDNDNEQVCDECSRECSNDEGELLICDDEIYAFICHECLAKDLSQNDYQLYE